MRKINHRSTKKYDGKVFYWQGGHSERHSAEVSAERLRAKGNLVRVEKVTEPHFYGSRIINATQNNAFYFVWRRKA